MPVWITDGDTSGGIGAEEIRRERVAFTFMGKLGAIVSKKLLEWDIRLQLQGNEKKI